MEPYLIASPIRMKFGYEEREFRNSAEVFVFHPRGLAITPFCNSKRLSPVPS